MQHLIFQSTFPLRKHIINHPVSSDFDQTEMSLFMRKASQFFICMIYIVALLSVSKEAHGQPIPQSRIRAGDVMKHHVTTGGWRKTSSPPHRTKPHPHGVVLKANGRRRRPLAAVYVEPVLWDPYSDGGFGK
ncbi:hypothetical protein O181_055714 [Austropuccinia psidii MF-1]|uniref:Uncharacterized protein n=1 Tax=Austropuccinia psidii MF-1 TaxID=1389203 RepID=A0A9Q3E729_9BASI|nr:hypothetical protein [Austropuccinia psidii MF-1]